MKRIVKRPPPPKPKTTGTAEASADPAAAKAVVTSKPAKPSSAAAAAAPRPAKAAVTASPPKAAPAAAKPVAKPAAPPAVPPRVGKSASPLPSSASSAQTASSGHQKLAPASPLPSSGVTTVSASPKDSAPASPKPAAPAGAPRKTSASGSASPDASLPAAPVHVDPVVPPKAPTASPAPAKDSKDAGKAAVAAPPKKTAPPAKAPAAKTAVAPAAPAGAPSDEPDVLVKGRKYVYDYVRSKWLESECQLRVLHPNRGLGQGGMRVCFEVEEIMPNGTSRAMVAKMFRRNIRHVVEKDYFNECQAQCLCEEFAHNFNRMNFTPVAPHDDPQAPPVERPHVEFVQCHVVRIPLSAIPVPYRAKRTGFFSYRTEDTQAMMFAMEPKLSGFFTKYTNNFGDIYANNEVKVSHAEHVRRQRLLRAGEAFSHFTLVESGGSMLVCDLQGVDDFLTDPQIHTEDGKGLGMGNMGQEGINKWIETHKCNEYCEGSALQRLELASLVRGGRQESYYHALNARLQSQSPVRPQDLVPLPKPLEDMTDDERFEYTIRLSQLLES